MSSLAEIITERSGRILGVAFNRPAKKNAMTMSMYAASRMCSTMPTRMKASVSCWCMARRLVHRRHDLGDFLKNLRGRVTVLSSASSKR